MSLPMQRCPKFEACNAPICPLDPDWRKRSHLRGDALCFYAREYVKTGGQERLAEALNAQGSGDLLPEVASYLTEIADPACAAPKQGLGAIRYELARVAKRGSTIDSGKRLAASQAKAEASHG